MRTEMLTGALALLAAWNGFAGERTLECRLAERPSTALVAGNRFRLVLDDSIATNGDFRFPVHMTSEYLGDCAGEGAENLNPLAEGFSATADIGGPHCAADGFDLFIDSGCATESSCLVQVNVAPEEALYRCVPGSLR